MPFLDENFMLYNNVGKKLFNDYAKDLEIIDYHCHLSPKQIAENKKFKNITELMLCGDHYKWRRCVHAVSTKNTSQVMEMTEKNSECGQRPFLLQ